MKRSLWFNLRKVWTEKFNGNKFAKVDKADWVIWTNIVAVFGTMFVVGQGTESPKDKVVAATEEAVIQKEIDTFKESRLPYERLLAKKEAVEDAKDDVSAAVTAEKLAALDTQIVPLAATDAQGQSKLFEKMLFNPKLGEKNVNNLIDYLEDDKDVVLPENLVKFRDSVKFLNECRGVAQTPDDITKLSTCMVGHQEVQDNKEAAAKTAIWAISLGSLGGLALLSFTGTAMRRRVEEDEQIIVKTEFKEAVKGLEDVLKPKKPEKRQP